MVHRTLACLGLAALALLGAAAAADEIPPPAEPLKDFLGTGIVQLDLPTSAAPTAVTPDRVVDVGLSTWFQFRQGYTRPDRMLVQMNMGGVLQSRLVSGDTERVYAPSSGYVLQKTFKNLEAVPVNPMSTVHLSMATYARVLREVAGAKLHPEEDLDRLKVDLQKRIDDLRTLRETLAKSTNPEDVPRATVAASEQARLRSDLQQIDLRRGHPCHVVEFQNKDMIRVLFSRGLLPDGASDMLTNGRTIVWLTRKEGLPLKIETTANDGRVAIFLCFTEIKINTGMHPNELVLGNPPGTRLISATVDMRRSDWEKKMDEAIQAQLGALEALNRPAPPRPRPRR